MRKQNNGEKRVRKREKKREKERKREKGKKVRSNYKTENGGKLEMTERGTREEKER